MSLPSRSFATPLVAAALLLSGGCVVHPGPGESRLARSVWVSRFDYRTQADIDLIMYRCAAAGFESVIFQVRGNGTTLYASSREVWSDRYGFRSPGFDPLSYAVVAAHRNRLQLHAWINAFTGWQGNQAPTEPKQLFNSHPDWFLRTESGTYPREGGKYYFLNPCLPEVRAHVENLVLEVAEGYRVDGIHLDYVRFPDHSPSDQAPGDRRSTELFLSQTRRSVWDAPAFARWKADCVTRFVRQVRYRLNRLPRRIALTAAVNANTDRLRRYVLQDWPRWARDGLVDAVFPMNYTHDHALFVTRSKACVAAAGGTPVIMGVASYKHSELGVQATVQQMQAAMLAGAEGVSLYSYPSATAAEWLPAMARWNRRRRH